MLHQLLNTICGIALQTQVNACRITLQQATINYNAKLDARLNSYKEVVINPVKNDVTITAFTLGKVIYDRRIDLHAGNFGLALQRERFTCTWRLTF
jgi:uncharacterized RmlC-like cupin family protein